MQKTFKDLTGMVVNNLTVIEYRGRKNKCPVWLCKCNCGNYKIIHACTLRLGKIKGCGCGLSQKGLSCKYPSIYKKWYSAIGRCHNPKYPKKYKNYGARGIQVCKSWRNSFPKFLKWSLKNGYKESLELDRKNNNGNYSPQNCRYVIPIINQQNKRTNVFIEYKGEKHTISEWARILNLSPDVVGGRLRAGWRPNKIIETPLETKFSSIQRYGKIK